MRGLIVLLVLALAGPDTVQAAPRGDSERGRLLVADRHRTLCLLCHAAPLPDPHMHGTIGPDLRGVGARFTTEELRLRVGDMRRLLPGSVMPSYRLAADGPLVGRAWRGKPILSAQELEDIVAFLASLTEPGP